MKLRKITPLLLTLLTSTCYASDALKLDIAAPTNVPVGTLVRLDARFVQEREHVRVEANVANEAGTDRFAWRLVTPSDGYDINAWTFNDGQTVVFATATPGTYRFVLAAAVNASDGESPQLFLAEHALLVEGRTPPKPIPPIPPEPQPRPDLPDGKFGLATVTRNLAVSTVPAEERRFATDLAQNYRAVAAQIAAGTLNDPQKILSVTSDGNRTALGDHATIWKPFFTALAGEMQQLDQAGRLATVSDYAAAWAEIAVGFDAVR